MSVELSRVVAIGASVLLAVGAALLGAGAASAATEVATLPQAAGVPLGVPGAPASLRSNNDAGYQAILGGSPTRSVATVLTVPTVTCASNGQFGVYPTAELLSGAHAGVVGVGIAIVCDEGEVTYESADAYAGSSNQPLAVAAGDQVQITVQAGPNGDSATVDDLTATTSTTASAPAGPHPPAYALVGVAPVLSDHHPLDVPNFGTVPFSGSAVDGSPLARAKGLVKLTRSNHKRVEIWTGTLSGHGEAFTAAQLP